MAVITGQTTDLEIFTATNTKEVGQEPWSKILQPERINLPGEPLYNESAVI